LFVSVDPHPTAGTVLNVRIICSDQEWNGVESRVRETMSQYSLGYSLERERAPQHSIV
jgi:fatty-acyl-CoA synthase